MGIWPLVVQVERFGLTNLEGFWGVRIGNGLPIFIYGIRFHFRGSTMKKLSGFTVAWADNYYREKVVETLVGLSFGVESELVSTSFMIL